MNLKHRLRVEDFDDKIIITDKKVENIEILISKKNFTDLDERVFFIKQVHSDEIVFLDNNRTFNGNFEGDAIVSSIHSNIGVQTADCLPVFIYSDCSSVIAVVHSGWRGTAFKILEKTIKFIKNNLQINEKSLNFILGVSICKNCYKIRKDMYNEFIKFFGQEGKKFFSENADRFDLKSANIYLLKKNGISNNQIFNLHKCSHCNNEFFSYRKGDLTQRTFNIIKLKK
jgi:YfiH family protein